MDNPAYLFFWCIAVVGLMVSFGILETFLLDDINDQIANG